MREQLPSAGEIRDIGRHLAGKDRVAVEPALLGTLHFAIPIGALDEPHDQPPLAAPRQIGEPVDQRQGALLIRLDGETEPIPAAEVGGERQRFDKIERQIEAVGLLGVDREAEAGAPRVPGEIEER